MMQSHTPLISTLIVDDDPDMQQLLCEILRPRGHEVTTCSNAESAWALCQDHLYKLIVLDYILPGMDGLQLCRQIRSLKHGEHSVILMFTGCDEPEALQAVLDAGADDYLAKSNDLDLLEVRLTIAERQAELLTQRKQTEAALEAARQHELSIGAKIQQTLLFNQSHQSVTGIDIAASTQPSQHVDGDFYDIVCCEQAVDVMIGDVMGKGVAAALLGAAIKTQFLRSLNQLLIEKCKDELPSPQEIVMHVQQGIVPHLIELESFSTLCYMRFDLDRRSLSFVDCGHTEMIYIESESGTCHLLKSNNIPLGFSRREDYEQIELDFKEGDLFICYSDGLTETRNESGELFGEQQLSQCIIQNCRLPSEALLNKILSTNQAFNCHKEPRDDLTCIVIKVKSANSVPIYHSETTLKSQLPQLDQARRFIRQACHQASPATLTDLQIHELELAVTEVVSNIINHAYYGHSDKEIQMKVNIFLHKIIVSMIHNGEAFNPDIIEQPDFKNYPEGGFGLYIIEKCVNLIQYNQKQNGYNEIYIEKNIN